MTVTIWCRWYEIRAADGGADCTPWCGPASKQHNAALAEYNRQAALV
jgi:hypothetical protein